MPGTIVVVGRLPRLGARDRSPGDHSQYTSSTGEKQRLWDYEANSIHLSRAMASNTTAIIVCREQTPCAKNATQDDRLRQELEDEKNYRELLAKVHEWNKTRGVPIIEAGPVIRTSPNVSLKLPKETIEAAITAATPVQAPEPQQRTLSEFFAQCCTLPKRPASLGIADALSSTATMVSQTMKSWVGSASRTFNAYAKAPTEGVNKVGSTSDAPVPTTSAAKESSFSFTQSFKDFVSWACSNRPPARSGKDNAADLHNNL